MRRKKRSSKFAKSFKFVVPVLFLLSILWVWKSTVAKSMSKQLSNLESQKKTLIEDNKRLLAELEQYRSIGWIDSKARNEFGMTYDIKNQVILLENQKTVKAASMPRGFYAGALEMLEDIWHFLVGER